MLTYRFHMYHQSSLADSHMRRYQYRQSTLLHSHMAHWDSYPLYLLYNPYLPTRYHMYTLYHHQLSVHTHRYLHIFLLYTSLSLWSDKYTERCDIYCCNVSTWNQCYVTKLDSKWKKAFELIIISYSRVSCLNGPLLLLQLSMLAK